LFLSISTVPLKRRVTVNTLHLQVFMTNNGCKVVTECTDLTIPVVLETVVQVFIFNKEPWQQVHAPDQLQHQQTE